MHQSARVTLWSYLEEFNRSQRQKQGLLRSDKGDLRRHEGAINSIVLTWQLTFTQIQMGEPRTANLLALLSQFQPQKIRETMLQRYEDAEADSRKSAGRLRGRYGRTPRLLPRYAHDSGILRDASIRFSSVLACELQNLAD